MIGYLLVIPSVDQRMVYQLTKSPRKSPRDLQYLLPPLIRHLGELPLPKRIFIGRCEEAGALQRSSFAQLRPAVPFSRDLKPNRLGDRQHPAAWPSHIPNLLVPLKGHGARLRDDVFATAYCIGKRSRQRQHGCVVLHQPSSHATLGVLQTRHASPPFQVLRRLHWCVVTSEIGVSSRRPEPNRQAGHILQDAVVALRFQAWLPVTLQGEEQPSFANSDHFPTSNRVWPDPGNSDGCRNSGRPLTAGVVERLETCRKRCPERARTVPTR